MRMQGEKGTVIGEKSMKNEEYKKLSIKEFTKAAGRLVACPLSSLIKPGLK